MLKSSGLEEEHYAQCRRDLWKPSTANAECRAFASGNFDFGRIDHRTKEGHEKPKQFSALQILEQPNSGIFKTSEEVDEYLKAERESWDN